MEQILCSVFIAVCLAAVSVVGDDCMPPKPGDKMMKKVHVWKDCCDMDKFFPDKMAAAFMTCKDKLPPKPTGPPSGVPDPEIVKAFVCTAECVFKDAGLIKDGKPDKEAIVNLFTSSAGDNKELATAISSATDKCYETYASEVDTSLECKSGAFELEKCVLREIYLNCPKANWNDKPECLDVKSKLEKCPKLHILGLNPNDHDH